jgi:hypothetical protein
MAEKDVVGKYSGRMVGNPYLIALRQSCPSFGRNCRIHPQVPVPPPSFRLLMHGVSLLGDLLLSTAKLRGKQWLSRSASSRAQPV